MASRAQKDASSAGKSASGKTPPQTSYQAPYYHYTENRVPDIYLVSFHQGHTIAQHFTFLGQEFKLTPLNCRYFATVSDQELFEKIRKAPGWSLWRMM